LVLDLASGMNKRLTDAFRREPDGSWTCIEATSFNHPSGRIQFTANAVFGPEDMFMGVKVAKCLDALIDARRMRDVDQNL
jgi:hypothetical protein